MQQFCDDFLCWGRAGACGEERWDAQHSQPCSPCCPQNLPLGWQDPTVSHSHQGCSTATQPALPRLPRTAATPNTNTPLTFYLFSASRCTFKLQNILSTATEANSETGRTDYLSGQKLGFLQEYCTAAACSIQLYNIPHSEKPPSNAGVLSFSQLLPSASQSH